MVACKTQNVNGPFDQTLFLGCSIVSFSASAGWNEQSSEVTVQLVQDECGISPIKTTSGSIITVSAADGTIVTASGRTGVAVGGRLFPSAKIYYDTDLIKRYWIDVDPGFKEYGLYSLDAPLVGTPVYFRVGDFEFIGFIQSWAENHSPSGNPTYTVKLIDSRGLLEGCNLILQDYGGSVFDNHNVFNVYGLHEKFGKFAVDCPFVDNGPGQLMGMRSRADETVFGSQGGTFGGSDSNSNGMQWNKIKDAITVLTSTTPNPSESVTNNSHAASFLQMNNISVWSRYGRITYVGTALGNTSLSDNIARYGWYIAGTWTALPGSPPRSVGTGYRVAKWGFGVLKPDMEDILPTNQLDQTNALIQNMSPKLTHMAHYYIDLSEVPDTPPWFRIEGESQSLLDCISRVCEEAGCDYVIDIIPLKNSPFEGTTSYGQNTIAKIIKVKVHDRSTGPISMHEIESFATDPVRSDFVANYTIGRELRDEPCSSFILGGNVQMVYQALSFPPSESVPLEPKDYANNGRTQLLNLADGYPTLGSLLSAMAGGGTSSGTSGNYQWAWPYMPDDPSTSADDIIIPYIGKNPQNGNAIIPERYYPQWMESRADSLQQFQFQQGTLQGTFVPFFPEASGFYAKILQMTIPMSELVGSFDYVPNKFSRANDKILDEFGVGSAFAGIVVATDYEGMPYGHVSPEKRVQWTYGAKVQTPDKLIAYGGPNNTVSFMIDWDEDKSYYLGSGGAAGLFGTGSGVGASGFMTGEPLNALGTKDAGGDFATVKQNYWRPASGEWVMEVDLKDLNQTLRTGPGPLSLQHNYWDGYLDQGFYDGNIMADDPLEPWAGEQGNANHKPDNPNDIIPPLGTGTPDAIGGMPYSTILLNETMLRFALEGQDAFSSYMWFTKHPFAYWLSWNTTFDMSQVLKNIQRVNERVKRDKKRTKKDEEKEEYERTNPGSMSAPAGVGQNVVNNVKMAKTVGEPRLYDGEFVFLYGSSQSYISAAHDFQAVFEFVRRYASIYGKMFQVRLPYTCVTHSSDGKSLIGYTSAQIVQQGFYDTPTTVVASERPEKEGGWSETPDVLGLENPSIYMDTFSTEDGRIQPFLRFSGTSITGAGGSGITTPFAPSGHIANLDLDFSKLQKGQYELLRNTGIRYSSIGANTAFQPVRPVGTSTGMATGTGVSYWLYVKASIGDELVFKDASTLEGPRAVLTVPQAVVESTDYYGKSRYSAGIQLALSGMLVAQSGQSGALIKLAGSHHKATGFLISSPPWSLTQLFGTKEVGNNPTKVVIDWSTAPPPVGTGNAWDANEVLVAELYAKEVAANLTKQLEEGAFNQTNMFGAWPRAKTPDAAAVPLTSKSSVYGPWFIEGPAGRVKFEKDDGLVPWEYNGYKNMDNAGRHKAGLGVTFMQEGEMGSVQVAGYPNIPLAAELRTNDFWVIDKEFINGVGYPRYHTFSSSDVTQNTIFETGRAFIYDHGSEIFLNAPVDSQFIFDYYTINSAGPLAMIGFANTGGFGPPITRVDTSIGSDGISTTYGMRTYTPKFGGFTKSNAERFKKQAIQNQKRSKKIRNAGAKAQRLSEQGVWALNPDLELRGKAWTDMTQNQRSPVALMVGKSSPIDETKVSNEPGLFRLTDVAMHKFSDIQALFKTITDDGVPVRSTYEELAIMSMDGLFRPVSTDFDTLTWSTTYGGTGTQEMSLYRSSRLPTLYNSNIAPYNGSGDTVNYFRWPATTGEIIDGEVQVYETFYSEWRKVSGYKYDHDRHLTNMSGASGGSLDHLQPWIRYSGLTDAVKTREEGRLEFGATGSWVSGEQIHQRWLDNPRIGYEQSGLGTLKVERVPEYGLVSGISSGVYPATNTRPPMGRQGFPNNSIAPAPPIWEWQAPVISLSYLNPFTNPRHNVTNPTGVNLQQLVGSGTALDPSGFFRVYDWSAMHAAIGKFSVSKDTTGICEKIRESGEGHDIYVASRGTNAKRALTSSDADIAWGFGDEDSEGYGAHSDDYRVLALRGPLLIHGWGYDTQGKPIPNKADTAGAASKGQFEQTGLKDTFFDDWLKKPHTWPVAPVDLRFDRNRGVWTSPQNFAMVTVKVGENTPANMPGSGTLLYMSGSGPVDDDTSIISGTGYTYYDASGSGVQRPSITLSNDSAVEYPSGSIITAYYDTKTSEYHPLNPHTSRWPRDDSYARCIRGGIDPLGYSSGPSSVSKPFLWAGVPGNEMTGSPEGIYRGGFMTVASLGSGGKWVVGSGTGSGVGSYLFGDGTQVKAPVGSLYAGWMGEVRNSIGVRVTGRIGDPYPGVDESGYYINIVDHLSGLSPTGYGGKIVYDSNGLNGVFTAPTGSGAGGTYGYDEEGIRRAIRNSTAHEERGVVKKVPLVSDVQCCSDGSLHVCFLELQFDAHGHLVDVVDTPTDPVLWSGGQGHGGSTALGGDGNDVYQPARFAPSCYGTCPTGTDGLTC